MKFEVGKFYKHSSGEVMHILGEVNNCTGYTSPCLIGEGPEMVNFAPIGGEEVATINYSEIPSYEYYTEWLKANPEDKKLQRLATPPPLSR